MTDRGPDDELSALVNLARAASQQDLEDARQRPLRQAFLARADAELDKAENRRSQWAWLPQWVRPAQRIQPPQWGSPGVNFWRVGAWALPLSAVSLALALWWSSTRSLSFEVEGVAHSGAYLRAPSDKPITVQFSDRSRILAAAGSRLRVEETAPRGARILIERGHADVQVVHAAAREWTFVAGPFEVLVTGTRFTLDWDPEQEMFELALAEGSVEVHGPLGSGPVAVRAGQRFRGDVLGRSMSLADATTEVVNTDAANSAAASSVALGSDQQPSGAVSASANVEGVAVALPNVAAPPQGEPLRSNEPKVIDWQLRITRGEFTDIVLEAEQRGVESCLSACNPADLRALSDAARYTGRSELAERSLLALRKRFAGGVGRDSAFLLGRLAEHRGSAAAAQEWYETYLREAPSGAFAAEALAGKMGTVKRLRGKQAAQPIARDYLRRFPKGVHIETAREILSAD